MLENKNEIRSLLINVKNGRVLLPNATVSEIITAATPEAIANAPLWLKGRVSWRGWRIPLFSFSMLAGLSEDDDAPNAKVTVLKAFGGRKQLPYLAMLSLGFPRLTTVTQELLIPTQEDSVNESVKHTVLLRDDLAVIPDLEMIEQRIAEALEV